MADLLLKSYQSTALSALSGFLREATQVGAASAFLQQAGSPYQTAAFGEIPCVCLRIPTGGGKTLLAAHAIVRMAREWQANDAPVAVWLVPSDAIRAQTLTALQTPGHPYRTALEAAYGQRLQVCDLDRVSTLSPTDWGRHTIVVVATIQSFRVEQTDTRNVYAFSESFERHFKSLPAEKLAQLATVPDAFVRAEDVTEANAMLQAYVGQPRYSLANWLALNHPLIVVDEAHNTRTEKSFVALKRLNPSAILELTATPLPHQSNVLYHVSAQELQAEDMIKLPITLREHPEGWQAAVFGAVQTRQWLETEAQQAQAAGDTYVRPIVLFQAQNVNDAVPPDVLRQHLINELHIPEEQIAIATGSQRDLAGVDVSSPASPLRYIITVQALREGWDCPFAYVLCSLQPLSSATAVEQLLGRVLRMPYAQRRRREPLNHAYAHVCEATFAHAATALVDRLVSNMGFEALDVASMIAPQMPLFNAVSPAPALCVPSGTFLPPVTTVLEVSNAAGLQHAAGVTVAPAPNGKGSLVTITGHVDETVEKLLLATERSEKKQDLIRQKVTQHNAVVAAETAPSMRGVPFAPVPPLGYRADAQAPLFPLEREAVLESVDLNLLAQPVSLPGFQVVESDNAFEIYVDEARRVKMRAADVGQLALDAVNVHITADDLVRWLNREVRQSDIVQAHLLAYLTAVVNYLLFDQRASLNTLARMRFVLARRIEAQIADLREAAAKVQFQQRVLDGAWQVEPDWSQPFRFEPGSYPAPASSRYAGRWEFKKHYYPVIADLKDKGEEFECARLIDRHPQVKQWVRNLDQAPFGFWLPTARGRFFPDFIIELMDGRIAVIEYKGAHLRNDPYEIEKRKVGELWAANSQSRCIFQCVFLEDNGRTMEQQVDQALQPRT
ncbi:type III restriction enzyme, res subunit [Rugosibacter aromaticivorans]|uniref:Type III restriction enzyme, res subunit n=1 Tax=Rugosibacter aromaticivorans TaxID=1565605 RepID=A0A0C5J017_9PROT|nr:DEAD/DEAH box helicase family protein [Rugosibacter aromaticivorans]AJP48407.1 type III restriction enzyme, res subunit [Rugosibacter aromaticivorans]TBR13301.1 MAG: DEAD/DEAH box helicase [Rugosibacter sp.]